MDTSRERLQQKYVMRKTWISTNNSAGTSNLALFPVTPKFDNIQTPHVYKENEY